MNRIVFSCAVLSAMLVPGRIVQATDVTKCQYDLGCTGATTAETILKPGNVATATFGKLFTKAVDGNVYAQPLYLQNFTIAGASHNVVYVCTENNSIYAFDADNGSAAAYWHRSLPAPQKLSCTDITPVYGITATPVINRTANALYVEAATYESGVYYQKLFAVNLATGADLLSPVIIRDTVSGTGSGSVGGKIAYDPLLHFCRPGLLLLNGTIYIGSGSHCDHGNYHGWLFAFAASTLKLSASKCLTPNGIQGSIWQTGGGISSDGTNVYCVTGNGTFGASGSDYGMSALKFSPTLTLLSSFTPYNYATLNSNDDDLCSSLMLIPGSTSCTMQGKTGSVYVMNRNSLGGFNASGDKIVQRLDNAFATDGGSGDPVSVFWNNLFYLWAGDDYLKAFKFSGTTLTATLQSSNEIYQSGASGAISLSASNDSNGIVWGTNVSTGHVYAFNASKVATMLWNDGQASGSRDALGSPVQKFARITVVNGKVYVPTSNSLVVYGLLAGGLSKPTGVLDNEAGTAVADNFRMTRHYFALSFRHAGTYEISVSDMRGCIVARARGVTTGGAIQIALRGNGLQPGAYIAFVTMGQRRMTGQAVIGQ